MLGMLNDKNDEHNIIPVADRARPEAWPAAAIVRSRVRARTICIVLYVVCMWLALLTSV